MLRRVWCRCPNVIDGRVALLLVFRGKEMDQAMKRDARHDMNEEARNVRGIACVERNRAHLTTLSME